jgi:hypothetical protein
MRTTSKHPPRFANGTRVYIRSDHFVEEFDAVMMHGEKCVIRILDDRMTVVGLEQPGMADDTLKAFCEQVRQPIGMLLVTGPNPLTSSGRDAPPLSPNPLYPVQRDPRTSLATRRGDTPKVAGCD